MQICAPRKICSTNFWSIGATDNGKWTGLAMRSVFHCSIVPQEISLPYESMSTKITSFTSLRFERVEDSIESTPIQPVIGMSIPEAPAPFADRSESNRDAWAGRSSGQRPRAGGSVPGVCSGGRTPVGPDRFLPEPFRRERRGDRGGPEGSHRGPDRTVAHGAAAGQGRGYPDSMETGRAPVQ
jgi:hypothetical protein